MNADPVIEALVGEMAKLIVELATAAGHRAPLADVGDRLFLELVAALKARDVSGKVIADMFGLALRSYQAKVRRLSESASARGRTLWEAVLDHIREAERISRADVLNRFRYDDEATVRGVLNDLVESGLIYRTGRHDSTAYRIAEAGMADAAESDALVRLTVNRLGPVDRERLRAHLKLDDATLDATLARLEAAGRIERGPAGWTCETVVLRPDVAGGPGAAVLDHVQAVVATVCARLQGASTGGGSTFRFEIWPDHPHAAAVDGALDDLRGRLGELRAAVDAHNAATARPEATREVTIYLGQHGGDDS